MLRPFRLLMLAALAALVYAGFFWVPTHPAPDGAFDAGPVATHEAAAWQAVRARQDFAVYFNFVQMLRERHRYTWFRALESGFYLSRATNTFAGLHTRYERVLPDLETVAGIEKAWHKASFDPVAVARAELNWWVTRRMQNLNTVDQIAALIAEELALRYPRAGGGVVDATNLRAQAVKLLDEGGVDPDWPTITKLLTQSYRALGGALSPARAAGR
jgi:hypothetical protein